MKKFAALLLALVMALSLAACGGAASTSESTSSEASTSEAATAENAGSDKTWVIATDTVFKPFEYTDASGGKEREYTLILSLPEQTLYFRADWSKS